MPKIVEHDEYRQEMLEKSFYFFSRKGYSNITMKEVAAEIGVSTGTLYHYFSSKENMLREMLTWAGNNNVDEYIRRTSSIDSISDRFDMIIDFWKEKGELYQNIMLLAMDVYRNSDIEQWKEVYEFFAERYIEGMSERLNISRQFARSIVIYFLGLAFHTLAFPGMSEYNKQIDFLDTILRPIIVDANSDRKQAAHKFKEIISTVLINSFVPESKPVVNNKAKTMKKEFHK